ncbi:hypothetical protein G6F66_015282 [Rhizopus arrhizus]|nr:hypothetical protein G6F66_015282 [Rhizopus arrhizus]
MHRARIRAFQQVDQAQQRGLARAVGADHGMHLAARQAQRDAVDGGQSAAAARAWRVVAPARPSSSSAIPPVSTTRK